MPSFELFAYRVVCHGYTSSEWGLGTRSMIDQRLERLNAINGESAWSAETIEFVRSEHDLPLVMLAFGLLKRSRAKELSALTDAPRPISGAGLKGNPMNIDQNWTLVSIYTRAQAIDDGTLIDITEIAATVGFKLPTAITATLFGAYGTDSEIALLLARFLAEIVCGNKFCEELVTLKDAKGSEAFLHIGPGDDGQPALTLMRAIDF